MIILGYEITKVKRLEETVKTKCFHCGRVMSIKIANARATNYCSSC